MDLATILIVTGQIFAITDPVGNLPVFYSITKDLDPKERHTNFILAVLFAFALLIAFTFLGNAILDLFHIKFSDFKIAGGILILVIAIIILVKGTWGDKKEHSYLGAVPLGCPLLVGPGAITTSMVALATYGISVTLVAVGINFLLSFIILYYAENIFKILGENGAAIIGRIMTVLLAAIAISFIHSGITMWIIEFNQILK